MADHDPGHDEIAQRAYQLYLERGAEPGHELRDWLDAEAELKGEIPSAEQAMPKPSSSDEVAEASWESFPASDAPNWRSGTTQQERA